ncbi:MAG: hypothetical protein K6G91_08435 [Kiritimatiellae bacterium]|nr:hypothetical protein [Kiritimatiellia bacterium]
MKTQETIISEIESDMHMTVKRRSYAYAGEHAGWLDRAAKKLLKVEDGAVRAELFLKIVRRALKLLRAVDDSSGSLQSVLWEGSRCFEVWKQICQSSDKSCLKGILKKVLPEDTDGLADGLFFPESALPIQSPVLRELIDYVLNDLKFGGKYRSEKIIVGCLGWLAQLEDENGFDELAKTAAMPTWQVWRKRFTLYLNLGRYDDAIRLARENNENNPRYVNELMLQVFERSGDRGLLLKTALKIARDRPTTDEFKRLNQLLNQDEREQFVSALMESALSRQGFDVPFCEVLFAAGELKSLHSYAVERYMKIFDVRFCTGMIPLAKKLFKAGDSLAACIFMRGAIYYLMGTGNSRYYNDVQAHLRTLAGMAASVKDWETVEPQRSFDSDFAADFKNRRTFWF